MKTLLSSFLVALMMSTATISFANPDDPKNTTPGSYQVGVYPSQSSTKLNVLVDKEKGAVLQVQLLNEKGAALTTQSIGKYETNFRYRFDLSELTDGKYTIVVTDGASKIVKEIDLKTTTPVQVDRVVSMR